MVFGPLTRTPGGPANCQSYLIPPGSSAKRIKYETHYHNLKLETARSYKKHSTAEINDQIRVFVTKTSQGFEGTYGTPLPFQSERNAGQGGAVRHIRDPGSGTGGSGREGGTCGEGSGHGDLQSRRVQVSRSRDRHSVTPPNFTRIRKNKFKFRIRKRPCTFQTRPLSIHKSVVSETNLRNRFFLNNLVWNERFGLPSFWSVLEILSLLMLPCIPGKLMLLR